MAKKTKKTKKEPKLIKVWCRLGGNLQMTPSEIKRATKGKLSDKAVDAIIKRGFEVDGDSYIPLAEDDIELGSLGPFKLKFAGEEAPAK